MRRDLLGFPLLGVVFGPVMVGEAGDSVNRQVKLALGSILKECMRTSSVERDECLHTASQLAGFSLELLTSSRPRCS